MRDGLAVGLDVGTSGTKGVLIAADGTVVRSAPREYPLLTPKPGWTEQEPDAWWRARCDVLRELAAAASGRIEGISLTGQMHGGVFLDGEGRVIRPALSGTTSAPARSAWNLRIGWAWGGCARSPATRRSPAFRRPRRCGCATTSLRRTL